MTAPARAGRASIGEDTIIAVSTGEAAAAIAMIRASGSGAAMLYEHLTGRVPGPPRTAVRIEIAGPATAGPIDDGLGYWFPGPGSYTGEDLFEITLHGGRAIIAATLGAAIASGLCRVADPGEFTRRAVLAGKFDLTRAEAIGDLVAAETEAQRALAWQHKSGAIAALIGAWQDRLSGILAHLEAAIDFPDEGLPADVVERMQEDLDGLVREMKSHRVGRARFERIRHGVSIVIVGAPNAGKSTLLNRLAARDAAIVSSRPGTTRDVIEVHLEIGGLPVVIADTAGLRETADEIEQEGVRRSHDRASTADLVIAVFDAVSDPILDSETGIFLDRDSTIGVLNKIDAAPDAAASEPGLLPLSALSGDGISGLIDRLGQEIRDRWGRGENPLIARERHWECVRAALGLLEGALAPTAAELQAEDIRGAMRQLARITGVVDTESILDRIFRDFCIGK